MSTFQRMTLIGINNYFKTFDIDFFEPLTLPTGYDKATFINTLLLEHGEKCVMYTDPDFMRQTLAPWSQKWATELERIYLALTEQYDPLYNYDRHEEWKDGEGVKFESTTNAGHNAKDSPDYKVVQDTNENAVSEHQVSADNSSDYQPDYKDITNGGKTTATTSGNVQNLAETSNSKTNDQTTRNSVHYGHLFGNIGTTKTQEMAADEVRLRMSHNLYDIAARLFADDLLIGLY